MESSIRCVKLISLIFIIRYFFFFFFFTWFLSIERKEKAYLHLLFNIKFPVNLKKKVHF